MMRTSVVQNPEMLRLASLDLRHGIPGGLFYGADERTRTWLRDEHARQRGAWLREQATADSERRRAAQRLLAVPKARVDETTGEKMRRMQALLIEAGAIAGLLADALPNITHDQPDGDKGTPSQELPS